MNQEKFVTIQPRYGHLHLIQTHVAVQELLDQTVQTVEQQIAGQNLVVRIAGDKSFDPSLIDRKLLELYTTKPKNRLGDGLRSLIDTSYDPDLVLVVVVSDRPETDPTFLINPNFRLTLEPLITQAAKKIRPDFCPQINDLNLETQNLFA